MYDVYWKFFPKRVREFLFPIIIDCPTNSIGPFEFVLSDVLIYKFVKNGDPDIDTISFSFNIPVKESYSTDSAERLANES